MKEMNLSQIQRQIDLQVGEQLKQMKQKLLENFPKKIDRLLEKQVKKASEKIWHKTGMATIYHSGWSFEIELNGKVYRTEELNGEVCLIDESGRRYMAFELNDKIYMTCIDGHLENLEDWSKEVADYLAKEENVEMTDAHWEVIRFVREYYEEYKIPPTIKILVKAIGKKVGQDKGNVKYLYELFSGGQNQVLKIAGLLRPHGHP